MTRHYGKHAPRAAAPLLLFLYPIAAVAAQDGECATTADPELYEVHTITFEGSPPIEDFAFSADGNRLFVQFRLRAVNIWALLTYRWPEIVGIFDGIIVLITCLAMWRHARRRPLVGKPYCPKCDYCLEGLATGRCPECGYEDAVQRAIVARPRWRRLLPMGVLVALLVGGYGWARVAQWPRTGGFSNWADWWSVGLLRWAEQNHWASVTGEAADISRIVEADVRSGEVLRTLGSQRLDQRWPIVLSPDGAMMLIRRPGEIAAVSTSSGWTVQRLRYDHTNLAGSATASHIAGFADGGRTAWTVWTDKQALKTRLIAWDLATGETQLLLELDAWNPCENCSNVHSSHFYRIPEPGRRVLERPALLDEDVVVRDLDRGGEVVCQVPREPKWWSPPAITKDGRRMLAQSSKVPGGIFESDLETGELMPPFVGVPADYALKDYTMFAYDGTRERVFRLAFRGEEDSAILVGCAKQRKWIYLLPNPRGAHRHAELSPDGDTLVVCAYAPDPQTGKRTRQELVVWDLSCLNEQAAHP